MSLESEVFTLMIHNESHSMEDLIINPDIFSDYFEGDYLCIVDPESPQDKLILQVTSIPARVGRMDISICKRIADAFNFKPFSKISVNKIDPHDVEVDYVEVSFKKQFLQRGNMLRFKNTITHRTVYAGQNLEVDGVKAEIQNLGMKHSAVKSGVIAEHTNIIFRSRSTRLFWLVQITSEMWEIDQNGDMYFEKFLNKFVDPLLEKWKILAVSHSLTVVYFGRTIFAQEMMNSLPQEEYEKMMRRSSLRPLTDGIYYQDYYKVVIENGAEVDKKQLLRTLKAEFWKFPTLVNWKYSQQRSSSVLTPTDAPQPAHAEHTMTDIFKYAVSSSIIDGNVLEAINTTLNILDKHYMDRDLTRTGNSMVMISAGCAYYKVEDTLVRITEQRMMDSGIALDFVSLVQPPLHIVPLLLVRHEHGSYFEYPYWINLTFIDSDIDSSIRVDATSDAKTPQDISKRFLPFPYHDLLMGHSQMAEYNRGISSGLHDISIHDVRCRDIGVPKALKLMLAPQTESKLRLKRVLMWGEIEHLANDDIYTNASSVQAAVDKKSVLDLSQTVMALLNSNTVDVMDVLMAIQHPQFNKLSQVTREQLLKHCDAWGTFSALSTPLEVSPSTESCTPVKGAALATETGSGERIAGDDMLFEFDDTGSPQKMQGGSTLSPPKPPGAAKPVEAVIPTRGSSSYVQPSKLGSILETDEHIDSSSAQFKQLTRTNSLHSTREAQDKMMTHAQAVLDVEYARRTPLRYIVQQSKYLMNTMSSIPITMAIPKPRSELSIHNSSGEKADSELKKIDTAEKETNQHQSGRKQATPTLPKSINPFHKEEESKFYKRRNYNGRRWCYVFPTGMHQDSHGVYGLNSKSLCQPAILPLSTDFLCAVDDIKSNYTDTQYDLFILPDTECAFEPASAMMMELISQRLAQEYQIVTTDKKSELLKFIRFVASKTNKNTNNMTVDNIHIMTLGHKIHFLYQDKVKGDLLAVLYTLKTNDQEQKNDNPSYDYPYEVWNMTTRSFQCVVQSFRKFAQVEYNWNTADTFLFGMSDNITADFNQKRIRFAITPTISTEGLDVSAYMEKMTKLQAFLRPYIVPADVSKLNSISHSEDMATYSRSSMHIMKIYLRGPKHPNPKWVYLHVDSCYNEKYVFHVEIFWLACDSWLVDEMITKMNRRASGFGLRVIQITEVFHNKTINLHPYRPNPYIHMPPVDVPGSSKPLPVVDAIVKELLENNTEEWLLDHSQITDWKAIGAPTPRCGMGSSCPLMHRSRAVASTSTPYLNSFEEINPKLLGTPDENRKSVARSYTSGETLAASYAAAGAPGKGKHEHLDRQYMQSSGYAAVRVGSQGFVWFVNPNPKFSDVNSSTEEKKRISIEKYEGFVTACKRIRERIADEYVAEQQQEIINTIAEFAATDNDTKKEGL